MNNNRKALLLLLCAVLMVTTSVFGTLAYLTDHDTDINTFTVGSVDLVLNEAEVNPDGTYVDGHANRVKENDYHLIPGHHYYKDPTVTVEAGSEESYVRMLVTFSFSSQLDAIFPNADLTGIFEGYDDANWALKQVTEDEAANTRTYEFRYVGAADKGTKPGTVKKTDKKDKDIVLDDLFEGFTLPGAITKEQLATLVVTDQEGNITDQFKITVVAHAIQADGFDTADAAWAVFSTQNT